MTGWLLKSFILVDSSESAANRPKHVRVEGLVGAVQLHCHRLLLLLLTHVWTLECQGKGQEWGYVLYWRQQLEHGQPETFTDEDGENGVEFTLFEEVGGSLRTLVDYFWFGKLSHIFPKDKIE